MIKVTSATWLTMLLLARKSAQLVNSCLLKELKSPLTACLAMEVMSVVLSKVLLFLQAALVAITALDQPPLPLSAPQPPQSRPSNAQLVTPALPTLMLYTSVNSVHPQLPSALYLALLVPLDSSASSPTPLLLPTPRL